MITLFVDTETTGLINYKIDLIHPSQPRIVQLAAILVDEYGSILDQMNYIIRPDGWTIPPAVVAIHGITTERAETEGVPMQEALHRFNAMKKICTHRAGYNLSYDKQMLAREAGAYGIPHNSDGIESIDVMQMARPICNMAPTDKMMAAGFKSNKNPKLHEAYQIILNKPFVNAHDAMADIAATMEIYFKILSMKKTEAGNII